MRRLTILVLAVLAAGVLPASAHAAGYAAAVAGTPGLTGWWRLGESGGTSAADSAGTATATWYGTPTLGAPGALDADTDTAATVSGTQYLTMGGSFDPTSDFSAEAWVNPSAAYGTRMVLSEGSSSLGWHLQLSSSGAAQFVVHATSTATVTGPVLSTGYWHHLVGTVSGTTATLYVDGSAVASRTFSGTPRAATTPLRAGRYSASNWDFWKGGLDELAVYTGALSASEVAAHHAAGVSAQLPSTTLSGGPTGVTGDTTATFSLASTASPATFQCSLDGAPYHACGSGYPLSGLAQGAHTLLARSVDRWGRVDPSPPSDSWTVDYHLAPDYSPIPPHTTIAASVPLITNHTDVTFTLSADRANVTWTCSLDNKAFRACGSSQRYTGLGAGAHTFRAKGTDRFGQVETTPASFAWTIDVKPPETWLLALAPNALTGRGVAVFGSEAGASFQCQVGSGAWTPCSGPQPIDAGTIAVRAIDVAGNVDPTPATVTVGATPPLTATGHAASFTTGGAAFDVAVTSGGSLQCQLDGGAWQSCHGRVQFSSLAWGAHALAVRASFGSGGPALQTPAMNWTLASPVAQVAALQFPTLVVRRQLAVAARRPAIRFALNAAVPVRVSVARVAGRRAKTLAAWTVSGRIGDNRIVIPARLAKKLRRHGRYRVRAQPAGGTAVTASFAVV